MTQAERSLAVKLPWQMAQWQRLDDMLTDGKLPHALLLSGPTGIGKKRFALSLAHYLMCSQPSASMPCGECRQCGLNKAGTHPDLVVIEPEEKGRQIKIDQVRGLVEFLGHTSQQGGYKVTVVVPAEAMNINAANALLKSLEEPTANTLLLLLTDSPSQLLPTIRSRCQTMAFPVPPKAEALKWLATVLPSSQQAEALLDEVGGQPMSALELVESDGLTHRQQMKSDFISMVSGQVSALSVAEKWLDYDVYESIGWLNRRLSEFISYRMGNTPLAADWQAVVSKANVPGLFGLLDKVSQLHNSLVRGANPNKQLTLEDLLLEICDKFHN
ncbi:MAG: DNA polymerase III subunit delta' [Pseudomonadales bacterium]